MITISGPLQMTHFYELCKSIGDIRFVLIHPNDLEDLALWDVNKTGYAFQEALANSKGGPIPFGEMIFFPSPKIIAGFIFCFSDKKMTTIEKVWNFEALADEAERGYNIEHLLRKEKGSTWRGYGFWGMLDQLGHTLHLPSGIQSRLCDAFDKSLGGS